MENKPFEDVFPIENGDFPLLCLFTGGYLDLLVSCCSSLVGNKSTNIQIPMVVKKVNPMVESVKHQLKQIQVSFLLHMYLPKHLGNILLNLNFPRILEGKFPTGGRRSR